MKTHPMLFSGPMVRAILAGHKTQTRRLLKRPSWAAPIIDAEQDANGVWGMPTKNGCWKALPIPQIGDLVWGRECFQISGLGLGKKPKDAIGGRVHYKAAPDHGWHSYWGGWHPSIHMPRWASRLTLTIVDVRLQRLQDINEADAIAEGCRPFFDEHDPQILKGPNGHEHEMVPLKGPIDDFRKLWDGLNEKRGPWSSNPMVAAFTFYAQCDNVDRIAA